MTNLWKWHGDVLEAEKRIARQESLVRQMERRGHSEIAKKVGQDVLRALQGSLQAANNYVERVKAFAR